MGFVEPVFFTGLFLPCIAFGTAHGFGGPDIPGLENLPHLHVFTLSSSRLWVFGTEPYLAGTAVCHPSCLPKRWGLLPPGV